MKLLLNKSSLKPIEYKNLTRLGTKSDGGYVIPEDQISQCAVLVSLGLSDNFDFDKEFLTKNPSARVIGVDHTIGWWWFSRRILVYLWKVFMYAVIFNNRKREKYVERLQTYVSYFSFFKEPNIHLRRRVSSVSNELDISLGEILNFAKEGEHTRLHSSSFGEQDVFLKMDIEGAEYGIAQDIARYHHRIRCIAGEFHDLDTRTREFNECFGQLLQHFYVVHVHGNNGAPYDAENDFPTCVEITLINKEVVGKEISFSNSELPRVELDFPNNPAVPDYIIRFE